MVGVGSAIPYRGARQGQPWPLKLSVNGVIYGELEVINIDL